jgi:hypothetical protein
MEEPDVLRPVPGTSSAIAARAKSRSLHPSGGNGAYPLIAFGREGILMGG